MIDVATMQTATNQYEDRVIVAPRDGDSILLDSCPRGTVDVHSYPTAAKAAAAMGVSVSTVYRQCRRAIEN